MFIFLYVNTGILSLLVTADMTDQPLLGHLFSRGNQGDFNSVFFAATGVTLINTYFTNAYFNAINFVLQWLQHKVMSRCLD